MLITISRQFAAGGAQVAERVAHALDFEVVDKAMIGQVAERARMAPEDVESLEERTPGFLNRLIHFTASELPDLFVPATHPLPEFDEARLVKVTRSLVLELARRERVVIVGRAGSEILADHSRALHVRLVAPPEFRLALAAERLDLGREALARRLEETDRERARYHREYYDVDWEDATRYDLVANTARLGLDGATDVIVGRARALGWAAGP